MFAVSAAHQDVDRVELGKKSSEVADIVKDDCRALHGPQVKGLPHRELIALSDQVLQIQDVARFPPLYEGHLATGRSESQSFPLVMSHVLQSARPS